MIVYCFLGEVFRGVRRLEILSSWIEVIVLPRGSVEEVRNSGNLSSLIVINVFPRTIIEWVGIRNILFENSKLYSCNQGY